MIKKKALICGVLGQDSAYLARLLIEKGYEVYGTSRNAQVSSFSGLASLGIRDRVVLEWIDINDFGIVLQQEGPDDFVIATGQSHALAEFVPEAFNCVSLDWHDHVIIDPSLYRPTEISIGRGNPAEAEKILGWRADI